MIVRCPSCKTAYRVADEVVEGATPAFRCSRCKHVFDLDSADALEKAVEKAPSSQKIVPEPEKEQELSFAFVPDKPAAGDDQTEMAAAAIPDNGGPAAPDEIQKRPSLDNGEFMFDDSASHDGIRSSQGIRFAETASSRAPSSSSESLPPSRETMDNILSLDPHRDQRASTIPYLTLFGLLLLFFGFLTALDWVHPAASERLVRAIPWIGPAVLKSNHLKNGVALQSLRAGPQIIQGNREVFVVTGIAQNRNPVVIREVRVAGQLYNLEGKEIEQQAIWIGNAISPRIIRGMTVQDISDLQRLKPLKTFGIPPGDSIPFTIVFLKSPRGIIDFSCEVLAAEGEA
jgi:predicted Zn finger-like uncharacterized protein